LLSSFYPFKVEQTSINQRLKILIKALGMPISAFSRALDVPEATTRNYTNRGSTPGHDYLERITSQFEQVNPTWLLTGHGEMLLNQTAEPQATYQKITGGNVVGQNTGTGRVTQTHQADASTAAELAALRREVALLSSQVQDKDLIIDLLRGQLQDKDLTIQQLQKNP
jgi:hypothetical protein